MSGRFRNLTQRKIYEILKGKKHHEGEEIDDKYSDNRRTQQNLLRIAGIGNIFVNQQISFGGISIDHRRNDSNNILFKISVIVAGLVLAAFALHRVEIFDLVWGRRVIRGHGRREHDAVFVNKPHGSFQLNLNP